MADDLDLAVEFEVRRTGIVAAALDVDLNKAAALAALCGDRTLRVTLLEAVAADRDLLAALAAQQKRLQLASAASAASAEVVRVLEMRILRSIVFWSRVLPMLEVQG